MKYLATLILLAGLPTLAATTYDCQSSTGAAAVLEINQASVFWNDLATSASSTGKFLGRDTATYSETKGYLQYHLTEFYQTNDSRYVLALNQPTGQRLQAVVFFDHDDHAEETDKFSCLARGN